MNTEIKITLSPQQMAEFSKRTAGRALSPETVATALLQQFTQFSPPEVAEFISGQSGAPGNLWAHLSNHAQNNLRTQLADQLALVELIRKVATAKDRQ